MTEHKEPIQRRSSAEEVWWWFGGWESEKEKIKKNKTTKKKKRNQKLAKKLYKSQVEETKETNKKKEQKRWEQTKEHWKDQEKTLERIDFDKREAKWAKCERNRKVNQWNEPRTWRIDATGPEKNSGEKKKENNCRKESGRWKRKWPTAHSTKQKKGGRIGGEGKEERGCGRRGARCWMYNIKAKSEQRTLMNAFEEKWVASYANV